MQFIEYQREARKTAIYPNLGHNFIYPTLGLCGESGEVAEKIKKVIRDNEGQISNEVKTKIMNELGDVLWYVANLATELHLNLDIIAQSNIDKLKDRQQRNMIKGDGDVR